MSRLVSQQAFNRVNNLLKNTNGTIVIGGDTDEGTKYIGPTVVKDVKPEDCLMSECVARRRYFNFLMYRRYSVMVDREIFGPILPIMPVNSIDEGLAYVNAQCVVLTVL